MKEHEIEHEHLHLSKEIKKKDQDFDEKLKDYGLGKKQTEEEI